MSTIAVLDKDDLDLIQDDYPAMRESVRRFGRSKHAKLVWRLRKRFGEGVVRAAAFLRPCRPSLLSNWVLAACWGSILACGMTPHGVWRWACCWMPQFKVGTVLRMEHNSDHNTNFELQLLRRVIDSWNPEEVRVGGSLLILVVIVRGGVLTWCRPLLRGTGGRRVEAV
jgi:hypothetical protein